MPNWTHNIVNFKGQTPETFASIISYITDSENNVDFDKIIPAPNALFQDNVPSASNIEHYLYALRQKKSIRI